MMQAGLGAFSPSRGGAAQPMGLSPGQMRPDMPNIPQIKPSGMGQAAALPSEVAQLKRLPREQLMQALMSPAEEPPKWAVVTALDQQAKENQMRQAQAGVAAQQQVAGLGTVAQEVAARPFARGGVVGFDKGGNPEIERILKKSPYSRTPEENAKLEAAGIPLFRRTLPADSALSRFNRWLESPFIREAITGGALNLSDEDLAKRTDTAASNEKIARTLLGAQQVPPTTALAAGPFLTIPPYLAAAGSAGATPSTTPASPATPAARRGLGTGKPPPADTTPAAQQAPGFDLKALQDAIRAAGTVSPQIQAAQEALRKQQEASLAANEQRRAALAAEGRSYGSLARAMVGAKSFGEALALAGGAAADQRVEKNKRLQELDAAADRLREALAEKRLADLSANDAARKAADVEVLKAQRDYIDRQRTFRIQEEDVRAKMVAAQRAGSSGAAGERADIAALSAYIRSLQDIVNNPLASPAEQQTARMQIQDAQRRLAVLSGMPVAASSAPPPGAVKVKGQ